MSKIEDYKIQLRKLSEWDEYLRRNSNLPSPRANLELLAAAVEVGTKEKFLKYLELNPEIAPVNDPGEFICTIGVTGLGKLVSEEHQAGQWLQKLKQFASDPRWRVREGVAMALQYIGKKDMDLLLNLTQDWIFSDMFTQRALVAGLCEPILLKKLLHAEKVLEILNDITNDLIRKSTIQKTEEFRVLKKALSYGWSVAMIALPAKGKEYFEILMENEDKDLRSILKENLGKNRLIKMDADWVKRMLKQF